jgi:O-antigen ligase
MQLTFFNFLLFFLPFIVLPFGQSPYEIPKVILAMCAIDALGVLVLLENKFRFSRPHKVLLLIIAAIILLSIYHAIALPNLHMFWGNSFRMQGIILLWYLLLWSAISSQKSFTRMPYYMFCIVLVLLSSSALFLGNTAHRAVGTLGEPNTLAAFAVFLWPFVFFARDIPDKICRYVQLSSLLLTVLVIVLSGSRSGIIAFGLQILFLLFKRVSKKLKLSLIVVFTILLATHILPLISHVEYEDRAVIWHTALIAGVQHPILGSGFGNTEQALRGVIVREHNTLIGYSVDSAHNLLLDWWVQGGLVGVSLLVILLILTIKQLYQRKQTLYLLLIIGVLTAVSFNPVSVVILLQLWWLIGQGFDGSKPDRSVKSKVLA